MKTGPKPPRKAANDVVGKLELLAASIQDDIANKTWKTHAKDKG